MKAGPIVAFFVAPLPVALLQAVVVGIWPKQGQGVFEHPASMFVVMCLYFYLAGLILGFPLKLIMRLKTRPTAGRYGFAGLLVGSLPVAAAMAIMASRGQLGLYVGMYNLLLFSLGGALAGLIIHRLAVRSTG